MVKELVISIPLICSSVDLSITKLSSPSHPPMNVYFSAVANLVSTVGYNFALSLSFV